MRKIPLKVNYGGHPALIRLVDFLSLNFTLVLTAWLLAIRPFNEVVLVSLQFSTLFLLCGEYTGLYRYALKNMRLRGQGRLWGTACLAVVLAEIIRGLTGGLDSMGRLEYLANGIFPATLYWYILPLGSLYLTRFITFKHFIKKKIRVAVIGLTPAGVAVERALIKEYSNMKLDLAFYDDRDTFRLSYPIKSPFKGKVSELAEQARLGGIDEIYIALPMVARDRIRYFLSMMSDSTVNTYIIPDLYSYSSHVSQLRSISNMQTISIFSSPFEGSGAFIKRTEDLVLGSLILLMISSLDLLADGIDCDRHQTDLPWPGIF